MTYFLLFLALLYGFMAGCFAAASSVATQETEQDLEQRATRPVLGALIIGILWWVPVILRIGGRRYPRLERWSERFCDLAVGIRS